MYFPAGTYRITGTLTLAARINVSIIGEDPGNDLYRVGRFGGRHYALLKWGGLFAI